MKNLIENYKCTAEELEVIKTHLIKHGYRVVDKPMSKPISKELTSKMIVSIHEPYKIATHGYERIKCSGKKGGQE